MTTTGQAAQAFTAEADREVMIRFLQTLQEGGSWYLALLDAVAQWSSAEEVHDGQRYCYLVANEAFDWLRLAERLCNEALDLLPAMEVERLLFLGQPPMDLGEEDFRRRIGTAKYRSYLNFFYGVTVEQALILAAEEEIRKEALCGTLSHAGRGLGDPYERVYGLAQEQLLAKFRAEEGLLGRPAQGIDLDETHAFLYWLFKFRLKWCDGARVASDTKKGLVKLQHLRRDLRVPQPALDEPAPVLV